MRGEESNQLGGILSLQAKGGACIQQPLPGLRPGSPTRKTSPSRAWLRLNSFLVLACLPNCLLACLPACLLACLPGSLPACLAPCLPACLLACLPACLPP